jgi:16S rRNA (adenine1518-N6/adenine1519-N6)-dimethyltransferase
VQTLTQLRDELRKYNIRPKKRFGQNFLIDKNINNKIIQYLDLTKNDTVIEIGAGLGNLTDSVAKVCNKVYAVEKDKKLTKALEEQLSSYNNLTILKKDFLEINISDIFKKYPKYIHKVAGNLPFYVSSPILFKLLESKDVIDYAVLMLQDEVVDRIVACPNTKQYGILSCLFSSYCKVKKLKKVSKNSFYPKPRVDAALVKIDFNKKQKPEIKNNDIFVKVVKGAFSQRRKYIINALSSYKDLNIDKEKMKDILQRLNINPESRAEDFYPAEFVKLANLLTKIL